METTLKPFPFLHQKISESLRAQIVSGEIPVGVRLPTKDMAKEWNTSYFTIQRALAPLVQEGLLESRRKFGTVVVGAKPTLTTVGIYYGADVWNIPEAAFYRSIHQELRSQIEDAGLTMKPFIESRPEGEHGTPQPDMVRMVEERAIQGLIIPIADKPEMSWISRLPVPKSYFGSAAVPWRVGLDAACGLRAALTQLHENGVRDVGLISGMPSHYKTPHPSALFYESFIDLLKELGMRTQNHWCAIPDIFLKPHEGKKFGYEAFQKIWNTNPRQRPKGLICISDVIGCGLFAALLEKQIAIPEQLRVVQYKNRHIGLFTPLNVNWVVWDEAAIAKALLLQLQRQMHGEKPREILISHCHE